MNMQVLLIGGFDIARTLAASLLLWLRCCR